MFSIGFLEICVICVVGLVVIGPQNLPKVMVEVGKFFVQVRRVTNEVKSSVTEAVREANLDLEKERDFGLKNPKEMVKEKVETFLESETFSDESPAQMKEPEEEGKKAVTEEKKL